MPEKLLHHLSPELWQTETSASNHCRREARRLGDTSPARALLAAAEHADRVLAELPHLELGRPARKQEIGMAVGRFFSDMREEVVDRTLTSERSYRGTLLGLRHGVDLVKLMLASARRDKRQPLIEFFEDWLEHRTPLIAAVEAELSWFAEHPEKSLERAKGLLPTKPRDLHAHHAN